MKGFKQVAVLFVCFFCFLGFNLQIKAQETTIPLEVVPIYPENQSPNIRGYFSLNVNQDEEQTIRVIVKNRQNKAVTIRIKTANGFTNPTGGMMYEKGLDTDDTVLMEDAVRLADYINVEETITVPALSSMEVPIDITVPETNGQTILGGVLFTVQGDEIEQQQEVEEGTANFVLKTETVFAVAIQLNLPNQVDSNFSLGEAGFISEAAQVYMEMSNDAHKIQEGVEGTYALSDQDGNQLFEGKFGPFKMAPKSKIRHPFPWGSETLKDGTYILSVKATVEGQEYSTEKEIMIGNQDVQEYIEKTQTNLPQAEVERGIPTYVWILGVILFGLLMFLIGKRKK